MIQCILRYDGDSDSLRTGMENHPSSASSRLLTAKRKLIGSLVNIFWNEGPSTS
jgi:hypothetical protein